MTFISHSHNLPSVGRIIYRYLLGRPGHKDSRTHIVSLLVPRGLDGPAGRNTEAVGAYASDHTLSDLLAIGFLEPDGPDTIRLGASLDAADRSPARPDEHFAVLVRRLILHGEASDSAWTRDGGGWDASAGNDFVRAASWVLAQDVLGPPLRFGARGPADAEAKQTQQFRASGAPRVVQTQTAWENFARWAAALGLGRRTYVGDAVHLIPDPTSAVRDVLTGEMGDALQEVRPFGQVLKDLYARLPVLGTGRFAAQLDELLGEVPNPNLGSGEEPASVSQALLYLEDAGVIELLNQSDAPVVRLHDLRRGRRYTHIRLAQSV